MQSSRKLSVRGPPATRFKDTPEKMWFRATGRGASRVGTVLIVAAVIFGMLGLYVPAASAGPLDVFQPLVNVSLPLIGVGALILLVGLVLWYSGVDKIGLPAMLLAGILVAVGVGGLFIGFLNTSSLLGPGGPPPPPSGYVANWAVVLPSPVFATQHDQNSEFPAGVFTAMSAITPAGTTPSGSGGVFTSDNTTNTMRLRVTVNTAAASTSAAYLVPDGMAPDLRVTLTNPPPAAAGGLQAIPFWGRISLSRSAGTTNNGSYADVFFCDVNGGAYLGFGQDVDSGSNTHSTNHRFVSYTNTVKCPGPQPLVGDWIQLGTSSTSTPQNGEWVCVWFVLKNGLFDYPTPAAGSSLDIRVEIGTQPGNAGGYVGNVVTWTISLIRV